MAEGSGTDRVQPRSILRRQRQSDLIMATEYRVREFANGYIAEKTIISLAFDDEPHAFPLWEQFEDLGQCKCLDHAVSKLRQIVGKNATITTL